jgi:hypothetical protein
MGGKVKKDNKFSAVKFTSLKSTIKFLMILCHSNLLHRFVEAYTYTFYPIFHLPRSHFHVEIHASE